MDEHLKAQREPEVRPARIEFRRRAIKWAGYIAGAIAWSLLVYGILFAGTFEW
jgi:hypothetical protein